MSVPVEAPLEPMPSDGVPEAQDGTAIKGRSLWQIAWGRLRRDKIAMTGGVVIVLIILMAVFAPLICSIFNVDPFSFNTDQLDPTTSLPVGPFSGASREHPLGIEPVSGRDILARIVYGARYSLIIAFAATALSVVIGVLLGIASGFFGGWADTLISRFMDIMLAFPVLLFSIAILVIFQSVDAFAGLSGDGLRVGLLVVIIGFFGWAYIGRIIRGQVLSLREKEFVDASRSLGARNGRILYKELLPNLVAPILVYATLTIPVNILAEAALSFLGVGLLPPTPSWGQMLSTATTTFSIDPWFMVVPGLAIFITVLAFNLFGDGLRDAFDPKSAG
ncbi:MAG: ABC transporter permease [Candidatus Nanopelagicales bacterium]|uniref:ABC transporter permease n=1 Tax=Gordonia sp. (in: high G+C Gram-positive bacteria) TaxID=84139 RepID=UPI003528F96E